ncbi:MAG: rRNA pseudouridine synthase [Cyclobacteriaceae bacterium]|nr:rRNA pseudouridine synthase [Cyclobacteriaceae bacterium]
MSKIPSPKGNEAGIRLNRYIAHAGVCSRREADTLIAEGKIKVNGKVVTEMGHKVKPGDKVVYKGKTLRAEKLIYVLLNKPKDFITTTDDPQNRHTVMELVKKAGDERIFPVGRLDRNTTGLLLLTNDGDLAKVLTHPSHQVKKIYKATLDKPLTKHHFEEIVEGFELEDGPVMVDDLALISKDGREVGLEIHLGRNRIVRRIFEHFGYEVVALDRVVFAGLTKKDLPRGKWRFLTDKEVGTLKRRK